MLRVMLRMLLVMLWEAQFGELAGIKLLGRSLSRQLHRQDRHFGGHLSLCIRIFCPRVCGMGSKFPLPLVGLRAEVKTAAASMGESRKYGK